jgi:predicted nucleotidyltransferase
METETIKRKIEEVARKIAREFDPERIILFGSWAWGEPGPDSDVDLIVIKGTENTRALAREIDGSLFPRPFPIDLLVYRPDSIEKRKNMGDPFITDLLLRGRLLYAR